MNTTAKTAAAWLKILWWVQEDIIVTQKRWRHIVIWGIFVAIIVAMFATLTHIIIKHRRDVFTFTKLASTTGGAGSLRSISGNTYINT